LIAGPRTWRPYATANAHLQQGPGPWYSPEQPVAMRAYDESKGPREGGKVKEEEEEEEEAAAVG